MTATDKCYPYPRVIMEIRINSQPCKGIKPNDMTHTGQEGITSGNSSRRGQWVRPGPTSPYCRLPHVCLDGHTVGGPNTIPLYTCEAMYGIVQLGDTWHYLVCETSWIPYAPVHNSNLLTNARRLVLNRHRRGLPPLSVEFMIQTTLILLTQYSPFPLIVPSSLQLCHNSLSSY
jgi:hypothetical protein